MKSFIAGTNLSRPAPGTTGRRPPWAPRGSASGSCAAPLSQFVVVTSRAVGTFSGQLLQGAFDVTPDTAQCDPEHALTAAEQVHWSLSWMADEVGWGEALMYVWLGYMMVFVVIFQFLRWRDSR